MYIKSEGKIINCIFKFIVRRMVHVYSLSFIRSPESLGWPFAIDLRSTSCCVCQFYIFNFLKTARQNVNIFGLEHLNVNWEIFSLTFPGPHGWGQIWKKLNFQKSFSRSRETMHDYNVHEALYQNLGKIMTPWSGVQSLRQGLRVKRGGGGKVTIY